MQNIASARARALPIVRSAVSALIRAFTAAAINLAAAIIMRLKREITPRPALALQLTLLALNVSEPIKHEMQFTIRSQHAGLNSDK